MGQQLDGAFSRSSLKSGSRQGLASTMLASTDNIFCPFNAAATTTLSAGENPTKLVEVHRLEPEPGAVDLDRHNFNHHDRDLSRQDAQPVDFFLQAFQFGLFATEDIIAERPLPGVVANSGRFLDKPGRIQMFGGLQQVFDDLIGLVIAGACWANALSQPRSR